MSDKKGLGPKYPIYNEAGFITPFENIRGNSAIGNTRRFDAALQILAGFAANGGTTGTASEVVSTAYEWADELLNQE